MNTVTKLSHSAIVKRAYDLAASILASAEIELICVEEGMNEDDAERMSKQMKKVVSQLRDKACSIGGVA